MITSIRLIYCIGCFLLILGLGITWTQLSRSASDTEQRLLVGDLLRAEALALERRLARSLSSTYFLALEIQQHSGEFEDFESYAAQVIELLGGISSLQLAPDGIVKQTYPLAGNEAALGLDLFAHELRSKAAMLAIENRELTLAGPFELAQGGVAMIGFNPVFIFVEGEEEFWGFILVLIDFDELVSSVELRQLQSRGYSYQLQRLGSEGEATSIIAQSESTLTENKLSQEIIVPNANWVLTISPARSGLLESNIPGYLLSLAFALLLSFLLFCGLKSNQMLRDARNVALRANIAKDEFLAGISHEIRTPLSGLIGVVQLLRRTTLDRNQARYVDTASSSGAMLLAIISDLLDYSRLDSGKFAIRTESFDLVVLIEDVAYMLAPEARRSKLELVNDIDPQIPHMINGDPVRLRQVLNNLINNSIRFSDPGVLLVYARIENGMVQVGIRDSSPCFGDEQMKDALPTIDNDQGCLRRRSDNAGIGLTICRRLIEAMGSHLVIENNEHDGNHFYFQLAIDPSKAESYDWKSPQALQDLSIAVLSPVAARRVAFAKILSSWQVKSFETVDFDCEKSLGLPPLDPCDLVIIDQLESEQKVNEAIENLRNNSAWRNTRVIHLVPHGAELNTGLADDRVNKPVLRQQLYSALMDIIYRQAYQQEYRSSEESGVGEPPGLLADQRILLVEDNPINKMIALEILEETGVTVDVVMDGAQAVAQVQNQHYDLVLMDIQLPVMDGYEATRQIRKLGGSYAEIPVLAITAYAQEADAAKSVAAGMNDHITKPFDPDEFIDIIVDHIRGRK